MYEEQVRHARHHETLRSQSTNLIVAISAAIFGLMASSSASGDHPHLLGTFLVVINLFGLLMSLKHYERSRLHVTVASKYRDVISEDSKIGDRELNLSRKAGKDSHSMRFAKSSRLRAYVLWSGLHLILAGMGAFYTLVG